MSGIRGRKEVATAPQIDPQSEAGQLLSAAAKAAMAAGMPANTRRAYAESLQRYASWAEEAGWRSLPATPASLTEFATWAAYTKLWAPVTIESARWAVVKWHKLNSLPVPSTDGLVLVLKGYREHLARTHSPKAAPARATAADRDSISAMLAKLDRSTLAGKRDSAIILCGFAIAGRRGEIASLDIDTSFTFSPRGMQVQVYRQKTRKMDNPVVHHRPDTALCPVCAVEDLIRALAALPAGQRRTAGPLFLRIISGHPAAPMTRGGRPIGDPAGRMTGQAVAQVIRRCALSAGLLGRWSGHSVRRGLATQMYEAGHERRLIERQGGWVAGSTAVAGYIDDAERWLSDVLEGVL